MLCPEIVGAKVIVELLGASATAWRKETSQESPTVVTIVALTWRERATKRPMRHGGKNIIDRGPPFETGD